MGRALLDLEVHRAAASRSRAADEADEDEGGESGGARSEGFERPTFVTGPRLNALYAELLENGRCDGQGGLAPTTARYIHTLLHRMSRDAIRWGHLPRNPADVADLPGRTKSEMNVWDAGDVQEFLRSVAHERLHQLYVLALTPRPECAGVNSSASAGSTSTSIPGASRFRAPSSPSDTRLRSPNRRPHDQRSVPLDAGTTAILRPWRRVQLEEKFALGPAFEDSGLVFTREDGTNSSSHAPTLALASGEHPRCGR